MVSIIGGSGVVGKLFYHSSIKTFETFERELLEPLDLHKLLSLFSHCLNYKKIKSAKSAGTGSSLADHPKTCPQKHTLGGLRQTTLFGPAPTVEPREAETRHAIVCWIAQNNHSFSVVEQPGVS
jgi:hypothetical protein